MAGIDDVRSLGAELERSYRVYVRGRLKFRVDLASLDPTEACEFVVDAWRMVVPK